MRWAEYSAAKTVVQSGQTLAARSGQNSAEKKAAGTVAPKAEPSAARMVGRKAELRDKLAAERWGVTRDGRMVAGKVEYWAVLRAEQKVEIEAGR